VFFGLYCHCICSELSGKELVSEMVHTFLLPEVEKESLRHKGEGAKRGVACMYTTNNITS